MVRQVSGERRAEEVEDSFICWGWCEIANLHLREGTTKELLPKQQERGNSLMSKRRELPKSRESDC